MSWRVKLLVVLALLLSLGFGLFFVLRACGLVRPFSVPSGAMAPAVSPGDHIMMEGLTFLSRQPRRGDIVVFSTDGIASLPHATFYLERVVGEPGEHVRISEGKLYINDKLVSLSNGVGEIAYMLPPGAAGRATQTDMTVPGDAYFVLGDNSANSLDSRFWGSVPRGNIIGRVALCYWPPSRFGGVK